MPLTRKKGAVIPKWDDRPFRILALDPGGTTGWAKCEFIPTGEPITLDDFKFECGHIGPGEHHLDLWESLFNYYQFDTQSPIEIVCESFEFRQHITQDKEKTKVELMSKEYIGVVKLFGQVHNIVPTFYTASAAKQLVPDKGPQANVKLKQLGWYKPVTHWVHAMDATRHLLRYMVVSKKIRFPITDRWLADA